MVWLLSYQCGKCSLDSREVCDVITLRAGLEGPLNFVACTQRATGNNGRAALAIADFVLLLGLGFFEVRFGVGRTAIPSDRDYVTSS